MIYFFKNLNENETMVNIISIHNPSIKLSTTILSDPGGFQISFKMNDWKYFVPLDYPSIVPFVRIS